MNAQLMAGLVLLAIGVGWGITLPLTKIAVSTGHQPLGLIFWQLVIGALALGMVLKLTGRRMTIGRNAFTTALIIALIGTVIPNSASYAAVRHLPVGVVAILMSLIPLMAFPMALGLGTERFESRRALGLLTGLAGVLILILPEAALPDAAKLVWIPIALIGPLCYAFEGNYVARWGIAGLDPIQLLFAASIVGALIALPLALGTGTFISPLRPWGTAEWALVAASVIHACVYSTYVWLVGRTGPVFAVQVSYLVTGFGVLWAMLLLGESYSASFWLAMALVLVGVVLVQPGDRTRIS